MARKKYEGNVLLVFHHIKHNCVYEYTTGTKTPKWISDSSFFEDIALTINEVLKWKKSSEYLLYNNTCRMIPWHHCLVQL